ncbi:MAG: zinc-ribbon domain-containing protein [Chloroflexi bacterium]|nr:zinc-ribbon domain-containing protein [Chloroflexota bacterium]
MTTFLAVLIAVATFAFIAYPLFKGKTRPVVSSGNDAERELLSKRDTTYAMLKELEFDYQSGVLAEEDYQELQRKYKEKAIATLKEIDTVSQSEEEELDDVEKEIRRLRRVAATVRPEPAESISPDEEDEGEDEVEKEIQHLRRAGPAGAPRAAAGTGKARGDSSKGADRATRDVRQPRQATARFCSQCGAPVAASDRFCSRCGTILRGKEKAK